MTATGIQRAIVMWHAEEIEDRLPTRAAALRAVVEMVATQAAVIARFMDGWTPQSRADETVAWRTMGFYPPKWEPMTEAERQVIYGVRP